MPSNDVADRITADVATTSAGQCALDVSPRRRIHVLAYVHLRNIHGSTGAGRVARQLTEELARRDDVDLNILVDQSDRSRVLHLVGEPWTSFRYCSFTSDTSWQQRRWFLLDSPTAESFWPQAEIVFCTGESYVPARRARLVVTAHDAGYFEQGAHRRDFAYWQQRLKWKLLFARLSARADMIHTVSNFSAERLSHFFPALTSRIRVVPNGVTHCFFRPLQEEEKQFVQEKELSGRRFVLVPGGLHFRKNADLILASAPRLLEHFPDLLLVIAGHCNPVYAARVRSLSARVLLTGFVEDFALHALYLTASAVWFPSRYEGFGMPVLEAMASGAAVVASNAASLPEIAGGAALLAGADNSEDHIEKLAALLEREELREHLSRLGRARATLFTWKNSAAMLKSRFDELL